MSSDEQSPDSLRILLVDDDPRERVLVQHTLDRARGPIRYEIDWAPETDDSPADLGAGQVPAVEITGTERLVVLEDDPRVCALLDRMLTGLGYDVAVCDQPAEAIERCLDLGEPPDLLLTDVLVPVKNGAQVADEVHARRPDLPVLFMTGYRVGEDVLDRIDHAQLLLKPFTRTTLGKRIRKVLDQDA